MRTFSLTFAILCCVLGGGRSHAQTNDRGEASRTLAEIKSLIEQVEPADVGANPVPALAGYYSDSPPGLEVRQEDALYLFPDRTYYYTQWSHIFPRTITDKGSWRYEGGLVRLKSDGSVPRGASNHNGDFLALTYPRGAEELLLLMGTRGDFSYFKKNSQRGDEFMLLLTTYRRVESFATGDYDRIKAALYS